MCHEIFNHICVQKMRNKALADCDWYSEKFKLIQFSDAGELNPWLLSPCGSGRWQWVAVVSCQGNRTSWRGGWAAAL